MPKPGGSNKTPAKAAPANGATTPSKRGKVIIVRSTPVLYPVPPFSFSSSFFILFGLVRFFIFIFENIFLDFRSFLLLFPPSKSRAGKWRDCTFQKREGGSCTHSLVLYPALFKYFIFSF
jgi:hypothetical protein